MQLRPDFIDTRVERRLQELERHLYAFQQPITDWKLSTDWLPHIFKPASVDTLIGNAPAVPSKVQTDMVVFPQVTAQTYWASTTIVTPEALSGKSVYARLVTNAEATVYVNGNVCQGLDVNRSDVLLSESGVAGETFQLDIMVFTTRDKAVKTLNTSLVSVDKEIYNFRRDLFTVRGVAKTLPAEDPTALLLWRILENTINAIDSHSNYAKPNISQAARVLHEKVNQLLEKGHLPAPYNIYLCGNSHIDVTWLWTFAETRQKMVRTTSTALKYMDELPSYHFAQSQAQLYEFLRNDSPELFERVKQKAKEGQWEFIGGAWVEPDCNITGGEALVRQLLYGQKFWQDHFGAVSKTLWLPDTFGYASAMPQILKKSGIETFVTQKLTWSETNKFPMGHFEWEGIDGSRIRCIFPQVYVANVKPEEIMQFYKGYPSRDVTPDFLFLYGYGDGGGGPIRENVEIGERLANMPGFPRCHFSRVEDALDKIKASADDHATSYDFEIPVWKGELYLEFHRGTLTTHAKVKQSNRKSELLLREAEIWASLEAIRIGASYPQHTLEEAWKKVLLNQFHDILPGTSIPEVYPDVHALYDEVEEAGNHVLANALSQLQEVASDKLTVYNSLSWEITDWVTYKVPLTHPHFHLRNEKGTIIPHQVLETHADGILIGFEATVPALGCCVLGIHEAPSPTVPFLKATSEGMENERFTVQFNTQGRLTSIFDKALNREWLSGEANHLQTFEDRPNHWDAWDLNDWYEQKPLDLLQLQTVEVIEKGPVRATVRFSWDTQNGSTLVQDVMLYRSIPRIDFKTHVDWKEQKVLLKAAFPVDVHSSFATYEIQYGAIERPTSRNTTWESAKFEVCGHKWIDLSEGTGGVSLLNDCKYGHDIHHNVMRISLLRTPTHPDPRMPSPPYLFLDDPNVYTDQHEHEINYAFYPHTGDWRQGTVKQGYAFNQPLRAVAGKGTPEGFSVSEENVVIEAVKQAEDGNGFILRVFEAHGGSTDVSISLPFVTSNIETVNLMEAPAPEESPITVSGSTFSFKIKPYEIRTFRIAVAG